jgi:phosphoserine phosphatase RsbU/P
MTFTEQTLHFGQSEPSGEGRKQARPASAAGGALKQDTQFLNDELHALRREHSKLQQAVFEAAQVQRRLCAPGEFSWRGFEVAGEIFPVRHLSGDFFKVMEMQSGLGLLVGDIAGKGLTAGIWQTHLMGLVQRAARRHGNPGEAVAEVNRELCGSASEPPMTALFLARIDAKKNEITYCNAGLPAPLVLRDGKTPERLDEGGPMLGGVENGDFRTGSAALNPGDMLVAYSDGATECRNHEDDEFGMDRLAVAAHAASFSSAKNALFSLLGTVLDFAESGSPGDDLTFLVVRRQKDGKNERSGLQAKKFPVSRLRSTSLPRAKKSNRRDAVSDK